MNQPIILPINEDDGGHWGFVDGYLRSWKDDLPEILVSLENKGYMGEQIPQPFELGSLKGRVNSVQRDGNHQAVLQWLAVDGNERITNGQKLFAEQLFELWKDFRPLEKKFPTKNRLLDGRNFYLRSGCSKCPNALRWYGR